jgi:23S rRNA (adenine2030-N6)-methyltransferase
VLSGAGFLCRLAAKALNYRHAFHAGNFADLVKHAALLQLLARLTAAGGPLTVIDTHAGRGLYDLRGEAAQRSGEWRAGIGRLMGAKEAPRDFNLLREAVVALNGGSELRRYPGSPWLIARALRRADRYLACELSPDEHGALREVLRSRPNAQALSADGFDVAVRRAPPDGRLLVLIDPPFERPDDYRCIVETAAAVLARNAKAVLMVWLPLKDLATFDAFLAEFEDTARAPVLAAETLLRPLIDPMKMNGCVLVFVNPPGDLAAALEPICRWTAEACGEAGEARVYPG